MKLEMGVSMHTVRNHKVVGEFDVDVEFKYQVSPG